MSLWALSSHLQKLGSRRPLGLALCQPGEGGTRHLAHGPLAPRSRSHTPSRWWHPSGVRLSAGRAPALPAGGAALARAEAARFGARPSPARSLTGPPHPLFFPGTAIPPPDPFGICTLPLPRGTSLRSLALLGPYAAPTSILLSGGAPAEPGGVLARPG